MADKIKVAVHYNDASFYHNLDRNLTLEENIAEICRENNIEGVDSWGLKLRKQTKVAESYYVNDIADIPTGREVELAASIPIKVLYIFGEYNRVRFDELNKINSDKLFLKHLVVEGHQFILQDCIASNILKQEEMRICLSTILTLLKCHLIEELEIPAFEKILEIAKTCNVEEIRTRHSTRKERPFVLEICLSILTQILLNKNSPIADKEKIAEINITHLVCMCLVKDVHFQYKPIQLINTIVSSNKKENRYKLLKEMNQIENRRIIYEYIVIDCVKCKNIIYRELYVYQCHILSLLEVKLNTPADQESLNQFENVDSTGENRLSVQLEFLEADNMERKWNSTETINSYPDQEYARYSYQSHSSRDSIATIRTMYFDDENAVCRLTVKCLEYFSKNYAVNFNQSTLEETAYQSTITRTAERIVRLLAKILRIGAPTDKKNDVFQPLAFSFDTQRSFFYELFSRSMWLLSKTRKEMQAYVAEDFDKVIKILEKQITMVLKFQPLNVTDLINQMKKVTYQTVCENMEKETDTNWKNNLKDHPCIQLLKTHFQANNKLLIYTQRMAFLRGGSEFAKLPEIKKKPQYITVKLSANCKDLLYFDCNKSVSKTDTPKIYPISNIRHVITGLNCPHFKDGVVKPDSTKLIFSLQLDGGNEHINFLAKEEKIANYWIDGLCLLLGKDNLSESYHKELDELTEMDCALQLMEIQNLEIPKNPPPVPPPPRPPVPKKSPMLLKQLSVQPIN